MNITQDMISEFNTILNNLGCVFRIELKEGFTIRNNICEIVLENRTFVKSYTINPSEEFYSELEDLFKNRNIELSYNNSGTAFWSKNN